MSVIYESQALQDTLDTVWENCIDTIKALLIGDGFSFLQFQTPIEIANNKTAKITHIDLDNESFIVDDEILDVYDLNFTDTDVQTLIKVLEFIEEENHRALVPFFK
jgi:hypothetical protein